MSSELQLRSSELLQICLVLENSSTFERATELFAEKDITADRVEGSQEQPCPACACKGDP